MSIKRTKSFFYNSEGFTLIEILVALALIGLLFASIPEMSLNSSRDKLEQTIDLMRRAVRYAGNEAVLRNTLVRMRFKLDKAPLEFKVEYSTQSKIILPRFGDDTSVTRQEEADEEENNFNKKFSALPDFEETIGTLNEDIRILGMSSNLYNQLHIEKDVSLYFYPSGERDAGLIIFASDEEIASLSIEPYSEKMNETYDLLPDSTQLSEDEFEADVKRKAEEIYQQWLN